MELAMRRGSGLKVGAVLLAAGEGSRMGSVPKCLLQLQGTSLINRHLNAMHEAGINDVVVVTGFYYQAIEAAIAPFAGKVVRNPTPEEGQQSSVKLGLARLGSDFDLVLIALADLPLVGTAELLELISAFENRPAGTSVVYPEVQGQRGNPVAFSGEVVAGMLASGKNIGCRKFVDANPALVHKLISENEGFVLDLDTLEDIAAFEQSTGSKLTMPDPAKTENLPAL